MRFQNTFIAAISLFYHVSAIIPTDIIPASYIEDYTQHQSTHYDYRPIPFNGGRPQAALHASLEGRSPFLPKPRKTHIGEHESMDDAIKRINDSASLFLTMRAPSPHHLGHKPGEQFEAPPHTNYYNPMHALKGMEDGLQSHKQVLGAHGNLHEQAYNMLNPTMWGTYPPHSPNQHSLNQHSLSQHNLDRHSLNQLILNQDSPILLSSSTRSPSKHSLRRHASQELDRNEHARNQDSGPHQRTTPRHSNQQHGNQNTPNQPGSHLTPPNQPALGHPAMIQHAWNQQVWNQQAWNQQALHQQAMHQQAMHQQVMHQQSMHQQAMAQQAFYQQVLCQQAFHQQAMAQHVWHQMGYNPHILNQQSSHGPAMGYHPVMGQNPFAGHISASNQQHGQPSTPAQRGSQKGQSKDAHQH